MQVTIRKTSKRREPLGEYSSRSQLVFFGFETPFYNQLNISNEMLKDIAFESQLIRHRSSIDPADLIFARCLESSLGTVSHNDLATQLDPVREYLWVRFRFGKR